MAKSNLKPTHRHNAEQGWQTFEQVTGKWVAAEKRPTQKLEKLHKRAGWQYFADPSPEGQPVETFLVHSNPILPAEKAVIQHIIDDTNLTLKLMTIIGPDMPSIPILRDVRDYLTQMASHDFWIDPKEIPVSILSLKTEED